MGIQDAALSEMLAICHGIILLRKGPTWSLNASLRHRINGKEKDLPPLGHFIDFVAHEILALLSVANMLPAHLPAQHACMYFGDFHHLNGSSAFFCLSNRFARQYCYLIKLLFPLKVQLHISCKSIVNYSMINITFIISLETSSQAM